jgi:fibro-slime domain-containing protein
MTRFSLSALTTLLLALGAAAACTAPSATTDPGDGDSGGDGDGDGSSGDGDGTPGGDGDDDIVVPPSSGGTTGDGDMEPMEDCDATLELIVRDFRDTHADFEAAYRGRDDVACGMVMPDLLIGADGTRTPVFQAGIGTGQRRINDGVITCTDYGLTAPAPMASESEIEGAMSFNDWYTDVEGVNMRFSHTLTLEPSTDGSGTYFYDSAPGRFFPADGQGFNDLVDSRGEKHNFHFTTEAHVRFGYMGGEKFTFSGDDDMWIFVNGKLALDLGGLHSPLRATIDFNVQAAALGIELGKVYNMDIFHAERHTDDSNYRVETNIACFETVEVPTVVVR